MTKKGDKKVGKAVSDEVMSSSSVTYKVWVEIEEYDEVTGTSIDCDTPGSYLANFDCLEEAQAFVRVINLKGQREAVFTVHESMYRLLKYLYIDEAKHFQSQSGNEKHIFRDVVTILNWMTDQDRSPEDYLSESASNDGESHH